MECEKKSITCSLTAVPIHAVPFTESRNGVSLVMPLLTNIQPNLGYRSGVLRRKTTLNQSRVSFKNFHASKVGGAFQRYAARRQGAARSQGQMVRRLGDCKKAGC